MECKKKKQDKEGNKTTHHPDPFLASRPPRLFLRSSPAAFVAPASSRVAPAPLAAGLPGLAAPSGGYWLDVQCNLHYNVSVPPFRCFSSFFFSFFWG